MVAPEDAAALVGGKKRPSKEQFDAIAAYEKSEKAKKLKIGTGVAVQVYSHPRNKIEDKIG